MDAANGAKNLRRSAGFKATKPKRISAATPSHKIRGAKPGFGLVSGVLSVGVKFPGAAAGRGKVVMVSVETADVAPGVTVGGLNEQLVSADKPVQARVTGLSYVPNCDATVTV